MGHRIGLLTPFLWTAPSGVNRQVAALASELTVLGHQVTVIAPSDDRAKVREARRRVRSVLIGERERVFSEDDEWPRFFFAGGTYPMRYKRSIKVIAAPVDLISNIDVLLEAEELDVLHLHEPFAPSLGWTALRHAACPLVATFHANDERMGQYWLGRPVFRRLFDSLDVAIASSRAVRDTVSTTFPGAYRIIPPGVDLRRFHPPAVRRPGPVRVLFVGTESRRKGLGVLMRALRYLEDVAAELELHVCGHDAQEARFGHLVPPGFAARVLFHGRLGEEAVVALYRDADVVCAPSLGPESVSSVLLEGMASGAALVASSVPGHDEVVRDGVEGLLVPRRDARTLASALRTLVRDETTRGRLAAAAHTASRRYGWDRIGGELSAVYDEVARRRRHPLARRRRQQRELFADFHMHSDHSKDSVSRVPDILERARDVGLDVVAITDHNSVDGGLEGRELAGRYGVRVIVGEEVKTIEGEVIGLFLEESIPAGLTFAETVAAIKAQGGIVYVPHPFDRLHDVPSPAVLRANVGDIDVMEVFNARLAFPSFNEQAERFARRYRILAAAGSDAHVLASLGTALTGMDEFSGPDDFLAALAESRIVRRPKSYLYLQSLKLMQTSLDTPARQGRRPPREPRW